MYLDGILVMVEAINKIHYSQVQLLNDCTNCIYKEMQIV